ncbi:MAG: hydantoinase B/oxoprolinase family protein, partial [Desulfurococcales archaeon]|nr:hydantoinase B/oxoprolinase family protein [Desulfurococcales archaeon]
MADPFTLEIITNMLDYAGEEMFLVFGRTAKSPVIYEVLDYAVAISDSQGDLVSIAPGVPGFAGILDYTVKEVLEKYGRGGIKPGDIFANNLPYRSGTHLNDVTLIKPVFYKDELVAFTVAKGHWSEVGGMRFGSWTSDATEVYQEGLQLPNVKLYIEGKPNRDVIDIIRENSRLPSLVLGDMEAQIAALRAGERRILEAIEKYGLDSFMAAIDKIHRDARRKSLMHLSRLPKGEFEAEDYIDDDGISDDPVYVRVKVSIGEDKFVADFTGSAPQTRGPINSPYPGTVTAVRIVYLAITDPHERLTTSYFSPLKVVAPPGTVFNPTKPAPTSTFWESMMFASDLVWKALAEHIPDKLTAGHFNTVGADILGGVSDRTGEPFAIVEP